jgi:hypothetical protein
MRQGNGRGLNPNRTPCKGRGATGRRAKPGPEAFPSGCTALVERLRPVAPAGDQAAACPGALPAVAVSHGRALPTFAS